MQLLTAILRDSLGARTLFACFSCLDATYRYYIVDNELANNTHRLAHVLPGTTPMCCLVQCIVSRDRDGWRPRRGYARLLHVYLPTTNISAMYRHLGMSCRVQPRYIRIESTTNQGSMPTTDNFMSAAVKRGLQANLPFPRRTSLMALHLAEATVSVHAHHLRSSII